MKKSLLAILFLLSFVVSGYVYLTPTPSTGGGGTGILTLNGLTADPQFFANDTNVTITSVTATHTLGWSGLLSVARGGTGVGTLTGLVLGNGASAMSAYAGTSCTNQFIRSLNASGVATCNTVAFSTDTSGTVGVTRGGTGLTTLTTNQVLVGTAADTLTAKTLPSCSNGTTDKLLFDNATQTFSCGTDQTSGGGSGITSLNTLTASTQTFANDTNVQISSATSTHTITWSGTLAVSRGGTGVGTLTGLVLGNGASAMSAYAGTSCTNQFLTALNASGVGTCTTATLAGAQFANQGTTTTVLHGNAAGNPSWGAIADTDLANNYSGVGSCTNQFVTATVDNAAPTCTTATLASAQFANQGTTGTLLHGNAAGNPSWGTVADSELANNYSGIGSCTNQFVRSVNDNAAPTCASVGSADITDGAVTTTEVSTALKSFSKSVTIDAPTTSASNKIQWEFPSAITVTEVVCSTDTGTVTIQLDERARATPNTAGTNVLTSSLVCDSDSQATTTFSNAGIAADVPLNLQVTAVATSPGVVRIHVQYTID